MKDATHKTPRFMQHIPVLHPSGTPLGRAITVVGVGRVTGNAETALSSTYGDF